jgi:hypothetical protein
MNPPRIDAHSSDRDVALIAAGLWPGLDVAQSHGVEAVKHVALSLRALLRRRDFPPEAVVDVTMMAAMLCRSSPFRLNGAPLMTAESSDELVMQAAEALGRIPGARVYVDPTFHAGLALRALMRGGMPPTEAAETISGIAMALAGVDPDDVNAKLCGR